MPTPGLSLSFSRSFGETIQSRNQFGPFGYGWSASWTESLSVLFDGDVILNTPGGGQLPFQPDTDDAGGSGVGTYTIYVSTNGGAFVPWLVNTNTTSGNFTGVTGSTYSFYSVATDNAGNPEATPSSAEATTTVDR